MVNFELKFACTWCKELFSESEVVFEKDLGCLCERCSEAIQSRGERLYFVYQDDYINSLRKGYREVTGLDNDNEMDDEEIINYMNGIIIND